MIWEYRREGKDQWYEVVSSTLTVPSPRRAYHIDADYLPVLQETRCEWCGAKSIKHNGCCTRCGGPE